jgi:hypothetical protein
VWQEVSLFQFVGEDLAEGLPEEPFHIVTITGRGIPYVFRNNSGQIEFGKRDAPPRILAGPDNGDGKNLLSSPDNGRVINRGDGSCRNVPG